MRCCPSIRRHRVPALPIFAATFPATLIFVASLIVLPSTVHGSDGRIEINQTMALAGGITPGDLPGFPIQLRQPGSYLLVGNLSVTDPEVDAIRIEADDVTVDLGGHAIVGPRSCTGEGATVTCDDTSIGGVGIRGSVLEGIALRNGQIRGFSSGVLMFGPGCIAEDLEASGNSLTGLRLGTGCIVLESLANRNFGSGLVIDSYSIAMHSVAVGNAGDGLAFQSAAVIEDNTSRINGGNGFNALFGYVVLASNTASANGGNGLDAFSTSIMLGNASTFNALQQLRMSGTLPLRPSWSENVLRTDPAIPTSQTFSGGIQTGPNLCDAAICP